METVLTEESPLSAYIEGNGEALTDSDQDVPSSKSSSFSAPRSFAPSHRRSLSKRASRIIHDNVIQSRAVSSVRNAYASAVSSTLGTEDNKTFKDHFQYLVIVSHLLDEHVSPGGSQPRERGAGSRSRLPRWSVFGLGLTATLAFLFALLLHRVQGRTPIFHISGKLILTLIFVPVFGVLLYAYGRRQWLKAIRMSSLDLLNSFIGEFHTLETALTSSLSLIQEVELVSRGFRSSVGGPLPPITRIEAKSQVRQCMRLRKSLLAAYTRTTSQLTASIARLERVVLQEDLDKFLDAYDIRRHDAQIQGDAAELMDEDERDSLKRLRVDQFQYSVFRRFLLCQLLSVPATGHHSDASRWRTVLDVLESLSVQFRECATMLNKTLNDEDLPKAPSTPVSPRVSQSSQHLYLQSQVRRISGLTGTIRTLQAKLWLLREDSTRALSNSMSEADVAATSASLREQYEALGSDLQQLMDAWETGKNALAQEISRHSRRVSGASLAPPTPSTPSFGKRDSLGLDTLIEDPNHALRRLSGEDGLALPLSPPATEDGSNDERAEAEGDHVFEGVSNPRTRERSSLGREQRIKLMREERERAAKHRESREAGQSMVRELQSVIKLRPQSYQMRPRRTSAASPTVSPVAAGLGVTNLDTSHERNSSL